MRSTFLTRRRSQLEQSKNKRFSQIAKFGAKLPPTPDSCINWNQATELFKDIFRIEFNEQGEILTRTPAQPNDQGWLLHHRSLQITPLASEGPEKRFAVTYSGIQLKNKRNIALNIPGELTFTVLESEKNSLGIEKTETLSPILDAIVMGENLGLLNLVKRRLTGSSDLCACENEIKKAIEQANLSAARRISYKAALVAIEAVNLKPSYAPSLDAPYQEKVDKLVHAAWELYHETPDNFSTALKNYSSVIQEVKQELIETDRSGTLNVMLRQLEDETSARLALSEIDTTLLTSIQVLMSKHKLFNSEKAAKFYAIVEETRSSIESEAAHKNPEGLLTYKMQCLQAIRSDLKDFFSDEKEEKFSQDIDLKLSEAIRKINHLLYFKSGQAGNPLLHSLAEILPKDPKNKSAPASIESLVIQGKAEFLRESQDAKWRQVLRSWFQPLRSQKNQLKVTLNQIAEKKIPFAEKLSEMEMATKTSLKSSKSNAEKDFISIQIQAQTLCAVQAFSQNKIKEEELIQTLGNCGHAAMAQAFLERFNAHQRAAADYVEETTKQLADEFREPSSPEIAKEVSVEFRASPKASPRSGNLSAQASVWAERQRSAEGLAAATEATPVIETTAVGLVH